MDAAELRNTCTALPPFLLHPEDLFLWKQEYSLPRHNNKSEKDSLKAGQFMQDSHNHIL